MPSALQFNSELSVSVDVSRTARLTTTQSLETFVPDVDCRYIDVYCSTPALNNVFYSSAWWGPSKPADTNANYAAVLAAHVNNLSDQPSAFRFDWSALSANAQADLATLDTLVVNQSSGDLVSFTSASDPEESAQSVKSLLTDISLMGTVWYNHSGAISNPDAFHNPLITVESLVDTLSKANADVLSDIRDDLFTQAYLRYKFDSSYGKLALENGDSFSIPVKFMVEQVVNYDLCGSSINASPTHPNNMLTFVIGTTEYAVMKQESSSNDVHYMLRFNAVGARENTQA